MSNNKLTDFKPGDLVKFTESCSWSGVNQIIPVNYVAPSDKHKQKKFKDIIYKVSNVDTLYVYIKPLNNEYTLWNDIGGGFRAQQLDIL
jgi:hypothetical protein